MIKVSGQSVQDMINDLQKLIDDKVISPDAAFLIHARREGQSISLSPIGLVATDYRSKKEITEGKFIEPCNRQFVILHHTFTNRDDLEFDV